MTEPNRTLSAHSAIYEIRIQGYLHESWSDRLGGMTIIPMQDESGFAITTLRGRLPDQAALFGVLSALYDMRLPLLSFDCVEVK